MRVLGAKGLGVQGFGFGLSGSGLGIQEGAQRYLARGILFFDTTIVIDSIHFTVAVIVVLLLLLLLLLLLFL